MTTFVIASAEKKNEYSDKFGPKVAYMLRLVGRDEPVEISQKPETAPPAEGQQIDGTIEDGKYGPKFKKIYAQNGSGSSNGGGRTEDPRKSAEIRHLASVKAALHLLEIEVRAGATFENEKASEMLKPRIAFFENLAREAGRDAN